MIFRCESKSYHRFMLTICNTTVTMYILNVFALPMCLNLSGFKRHRRSSVHGINRLCFGVLYYVHLYRCFFTCCDNKGQQRHLLAAPRQLVCVPQPEMFRFLTSYRCFLGPATEKRCRGWAIWSSSPFVIWRNWNNSKFILNHNIIS